MAKIINCENMFRQTSPSLSVFEKKISEYKDFLTLYENINDYDACYLIFHKPLNDEQSFIDIPCPHCALHLNENTMHKQTISVHGKVGETTDLNDVNNWGLLELLCPHCKNKNVVIFEW